MNVSAAPPLELHFWNYTNQQGGQDMYSEDNVGSGGINNTFLEADCVFCAANVRARQPV